MIQIMVHARHGEPILARMPDHLECHPIAAEEQQISTAAPVGLDDRTRIAGWKRMQILVRTPSPTIPTP